VKTTLPLGHTLKLSLTYLKQAYLILGLFLIVQPLAFAKTNHHYISHAVKDNSLVINTSLGQVHLNAYGDGAIEAHYLIDDALVNESPSLKKAVAQQLPSFAIKEQATKQHFKLAENAQQLSVTSNKLSAIITKSPFKISYYQSGKLLIAEESGIFLGIAQDADKQNALTNVQGFRFKLSDKEKLLGGGERVLGMDRRGHRLPLYNRAHYGYETQSTQMNFSLPVVMSSNKYILLFDNSAKGWMDIAKSEKNILQFEAVSGRLAYIVFAADT